MPKRATKNEAKFFEEMYRVKNPKEKIKTKDEMKFIEEFLKETNHLMSMTK